VDGTNILVLELAMAEVEHELKRNHLAYLYVSIYLFVMQMYYITVSVLIDCIS